MACRQTFQSTPLYTTQCVNQIFGVSAKFAKVLKAPLHYQNIGILTFRQGISFFNQSSSICCFFPFFPFSIVLTPFPCARSAVVTMLCLPCSWPSLWPCLWHGRRWWSGHRAHCEPVWEAHHARWPPGHSGPATQEERGIMNTSFTNGCSAKST